MSGKFVSGILLARPGHVGMPEHAMRGHFSTKHDATAQRYHGGDLTQRKIWIPPVVAAIDDLDPDRTGIDIFFAGPERHAGMPGALGFGDALHDTPVFQNDIVG